MRPITALMGLRSFLLTFKRAATYAGLAYLIASPMYAQLTPQTASATPQVNTLVGQAVAALGGSVAVSDLILIGTVTRMVGGTKESGSATLKLRGTGKSLLDLSTGSDRRVEMFNDSNGGPDGEWIGTDGIPHRMSPHNCLVPAGGFVPHGLVSLMVRSDATVTYIGAESRNGVRVDHLRAFRTFPRQTAKMTATLQRLSTFDVYLDSTSHLPLAVTFNLHLDDDLSRDIPVEVRFADYRNVNGVLIPFRIQRRIQGGLELDVTVSIVTVNSGLSDSDFALR
jgi:hypothetical protein